MKQSHIGDAFFDADAAAFLKGELERSKSTPGGGPSLEKQGSRQHGSHLALQCQHEPVSISVCKAAILSATMSASCLCLALFTTAQSFCVIVQTECSTGSFRPCSFVIAVPHMTTQEKPVCGASLLKKYQEGLTYGHVL